MSSPRGTFDQIAGLGETFYKRFFSGISYGHLHAEMVLAKAQGRSLIHELAVLEVNKRKTLGLDKPSQYGPDRKIPKSKKYTEEELQVLTEFSQDLMMSIEEVMESLPGRSKTAIYNKLNRMGLSRPLWPDPEEES